MIDLIREILSKRNEVCYLNYGVVLPTKNNVTYYVKDIVLEVEDIMIKINLIDDAEYEEIMNLIVSHNKEIDKKYLKCKKRRSDNNE